MWRHRKRTLHRHAIYWRRRRRRRLRRDAISRGHGYNRLRRHSRDCRNYGRGRRRWHGVNAWLGRRRGPRWRNWRRSRVRRRGKHPCVFAGPLLSGGWRRRRLRGRGWCWRRGRRTEQPRVFTGALRRCCRRRGRGGRSVPWSGEHVCRGAGWCTLWRRGRRRRRRRARPGTCAKKPRKCAWILCAGTRRNGRRRLVQKLSAGTRFGQRRLEKPRELARISRFL